MIFIKYFKINFFRTRPFFLWFDENVSNKLVAHIVCRQFNNTALQKTVYLLWRFCYFNAIALNGVQNSMICRNSFPHSNVVASSKILVSIVTSILYVCHCSRILLLNHFAFFGCLIISIVICRMCRLVPVVSGRM